MSEILSNTGVKLWAETDYSELWLTVFDQLTGQGGKSNIRLIDEAIGKINAALDGYKFEFSSDEDRLYISKGDSKLPVSLIDSNGHVASKVDGTTITIDESGVVKGIPVDDALSEESTNPLQNKVIAGELKSIKSKMGTDESTIQNNTKRIEANETAISTLNGTGNGSVKKAVSDGIAKVVAGAPEDFDTLKEMSDWISTHETSASAMNSQIQDNKKAIDNHTLNGDIHVTPENKTNWNKVSEKLDKTGDASNVITEFTTATTRSNLTTKEKLSISLGKISKWFSDLKTVAFSGSYNDLSNKPASLPANGGNSTTVNGHTVNSDVPANAKFTDTTYGVATTTKTGIVKPDGTTITADEDGTLHGVAKITVDTALSPTSTNPVQNKVVTSHLTDLKYGEVAGGKNLLNPNKTIIGELVEGMVTSGENYISDYIPIKSETSYSISNCTQGSNEVAWYTSDKTYISRSFTTPVISPSNASYVRIEYADNINAQLEEGSVATSYEPYIPSVKMLAEENAQQSTEIMDIKMLGWAVPRECPIRNEVNGNQFVQKVGRVDLGSLDWNLRADGSFENELFTSLPVGTTPDDEKYYAIYSNLYKSSSWDVVVNSNVQDMVITLYKFYSWPYASIAIRNKKYTNVDSFKKAMQGQYLYYELATPITKTIDGNEIGETVSDVRKETTVNLLNLTLKTTTKNGITCTNNGDGTYTLNGTASINTYFIMSGVIYDKNIINKYEGSKLVGAPSGSSYESFYLFAQFNGGQSTQKVYNDYGNGIKLNNIKGYETLEIIIYVKSGKTVSNLTFKPMLTTNFNATYDDFVPYTGSTGKLNGDVAELKAQSVKKDNVVNNQTTTEEGFALDARQANPNIDGSLAKQISDLNGSLDNVAPKEESVLRSSDGIVSLSIYNDSLYITYNKDVSKDYYAQLIIGTSGMTLITNDSSGYNTKQIVNFQ